MHRQNVIRFCLLALACALVVMAGYAKGPGMLSAVMTRLVAGSSFVSRDRLEPNDDAYPAPEFAPERGSIPNR
jgi:hypothetical protein